MSLVFEELSEGLAVPHVVDGKLARPLGVGVARLDRVVAQMDRLVARVQGERTGAEPGAVEKNLLIVATRSLHY